MKPTLPASLLRSRIPRNRQSLKSTAGQLDEILLQRLDAERVADLEIRELSVCTVGADEELAIALEERARRATLRDVRVAEVAGNAAVTRRRHGGLVLRLPPVGGLAAVAGFARLCADIVSRRRGGRRARRTDSFRVRSRHGEPNEAQGGDCHDDGAHQHGRPLWGARALRFCATARSAHGFLFLIAHDVRAPGLDKDSASIPGILRKL